MKQQEIEHVLVCEHCGCELTVMKECENAFEGKSCSTLFQLSAVTSQ